MPRLRRSSLPASSFLRSAASKASGSSFSSSLTKPESSNDSVAHQPLRISTVSPGSGRLPVSSRKRPPLASGSSRAPSGTSSFERLPTSPVAGPTCQGSFCISARTSCSDSAGAAAAGNAKAAARATARADAGARQFMFDMDFLPAVGSGSCRCAPTASCMVCGRIITRAPRPRSPPRPSETLGTRNRAGSPLAQRVSERGGHNHAHESGLLFPAARRRPPSPARAHGGAGHRPDARAFAHAGRSRRGAGAIGTRVAARARAGARALARQRAGRGGDPARRRTRARRGAGRAQ